MIYKVFILIWISLVPLQSEKKIIDTVPQAIRTSKQIRELDREMKRTILIFNRKKHELDSMLSLIQKKSTTRSQKRRIRRAKKRLEQVREIQTGIPDTIVLIDTIFPSQEIIETRIDISPNFDKPKRKWLFFNRKN